MSRFRSASAALALSLAAAGPAHAQWEGLGDPGWGWKPPVCHLCVSSAELSLGGGVGTADDPLLRDDLGDVGRLSAKAKHYAVGLRLGLGPLLFVDGSLQRVDGEAEASGFESERTLDVVRIGAGFFLISRPGVGGLYVRGGALQLQDDWDLSLNATSEAGEAGASTGYTAQDRREFGLSLGALWRWGTTVFEARYGQYGDIGDGVLTLGYDVGQVMRFNLGATYLDLGDTGSGTTFGATPKEVREVRFIPLDDERLWLYGIGMTIRF